MSRQSKYFSIAFLLQIAALMGFHNSTLAQVAYGNWQLQASAGISNISGDVSGRTGFGGGIGIETGVAKGFALRLDYTGSVNYGLDTKTVLASGINANKSDVWKIYYGQQNKSFATNYRDRIHQASLNGVFSLGKWKIMPTNSLSLYGILGYSLVVADVDVNALNTDLKAYNFGSVNFNGTKSEIKTQLKSLLDKSYESNYHPEIAPGSKQKNLFIDHGPQIGLGLKFDLTKRMDIGLEYRLTKPMQDDLDGVSAGSKGDIIHFTHVRFGIALGSTKKKVVRNINLNGTQAIRTTPEVLMKESK